MKSPVASKRGLISGMRANTIRDIRRRTSIDMFGDKKRFSKIQIGSDRREAALHGDGIVGVARNVPAWTHAAVREQRVGAGNILFGLLRVNFVIHLIVLEMNSKKADAVDAPGGNASGGIVEADLEPKRITEKRKEKKYQHALERTKENALESPRWFGRNSW